MLCLSKGCLYIASGATSSIREVTGTCRPIDKLKSAPATSPLSPLLSSSSHARCPLRNSPQICYFSERSPTPTNSLTRRPSRQKPHTTPAGKHTPYRLPPVAHATLQRACLVPSIQKARSSAISSSALLTTWVDSCASDRDNRRPWRQSDARNLFSPTTMSSTLRNCTTISGSA